MATSSIGDCVRAAPSPQAGILLFVVLQEVEANPTTYYGPGWAGLTTEEWLRRTGLSPDALKHALRRLGEAGLIQRRYWRSEDRLMLRPVLACKTPHQSIAKEPAQEQVAA